MLLSKYINGKISIDVRKTMLQEAEKQGALIAEGVLNMVKTQDQLLRIKLNGDLSLTTLSTLLSVRSK